MIGTVRWPYASLVKSEGTVEVDYSWWGGAARVLRPVLVEIIEAFRCIGQRLSLIDLAGVT
jgi:hypothetical protein